MDIHIIIVSYNVASLLRDCLKSVYASTGVRFTVTVVDNRSSDSSAEMVRTEFPDTELIVSPVNGGYAYGNNVALRRHLQPGPESAGARYALLLNPDTVLPPTALAEMTAYLDRHPEAGVAGPKLLRQDGSLDLACRRSFPTPEVSFYRLSGLSRLFPRHPRFGRYNMTFLSPDVETEVDAVVGAFMMVRTEAIRQAGILDETFFMYGEDLDWAFRIKEKGWTVRYNPAVSVLHYKGESSRQSTFRTTKAFYEAMEIFYRKHYASTSPFLVSWAVLGGIRLALAKAWLMNKLRPSAKRWVGSARPVGATEQQ